MIVTVCVGSSCHLKGSHDVVALMKQAIADNKLEDDVTLAGNFCIGKCNRVGVTVQVDDDIYTGITVDNFNEFFRNHVLNKLQEERSKDNG